MAGGGPSWGYNMSSLAAHPIDFETSTEKPRLLWPFLVVSAGGVVIVAWIGVLGWFLLELLGAV